jgi:glutathione-specific gamma-glutamylcyclotransferase
MVAQALNGRRPRKLALTQELVACCWRMEQDAGHDSRYTLLTSEEFLALAERLVVESGDELWIFAYGSLIWKPVFTPIDALRGSALGWHRSFCLELTNWRGTPAQPGLMMALQRGGQCDGIAYRLSDENRFDQILDLLDREISYLEDVHAIRWIKVRTPRGTIRALSFWTGPSGVGIYEKLPLPDVARVLARACGFRGSCAEYLYNTVVHLDECGIYDRNLWRLQELVAAEIIALQAAKVAVATEA